MSETLSPKQVARAIGVSESSLKRWCDRGMISFIKTAGGHRRLRLPDVVEFIRQQGHSLVEPEVLGLPATTGTGPRSLPRAKEQLVEALVAGDEAAARTVIVDLVLAGHPMSAICDTVIAETFHEVGDLWDCGTVEVYQERRSCEIITRILHELRSFLQDPSPRAPLAIGGTPTADPYSLATTMAELVLVENGWRAASLGTNLPFDTLTAAVRDHRPRLFWLSVSAVDDEDRFREEYAAFAEFVLSAGTALLVGGRGLTESLRRQMKYTAFCDQMQHLESFAQTYRRGASSLSDVSESNIEN